MRSLVLVFSGLVIYSAGALGGPRQLFDKGAWKDAVAEANRDIRAQPKNGRLHAAFAQLLVNIGLGDAARREARLAVQLQPDDAFNHVALGWTLAHDAFGRSYATGSDRAGALAEFEKARKLDPKSSLAASELGNLLAHGAGGKLWGRGSDAKGSAVAKRAAYDLDPNAATAVELLNAMVWAGDFAGAEQLAKVAPPADDRDGFWLVAVAGRSDAAAAIRAANTLGSPDARKQALGLAAYTLFSMRRYDDARTLYAELHGPGARSGADFANLAVRDKPLDRKTPAGAAIEAEIVFVRDGKQEAMWDAKTEAEMAIAWNAQSHIGGNTAKWSDDMVADMMRSATTTHVEGDKKAWRIELVSTGKPEFLYAADDHGTIKLIGSAADPRGAGRHALRLIANNELEAARRLLDWAEQDAKKSWLFEIVWGPNHAIDREAVELAAAVLTATSDPDHARPILEACAGAPPRGDVVCTLVLAELSNARGAWPETIALLSARLTAHPKEPFTARGLAFALVLAGRPKEAEAALRDVGAPSDAGFAKLRMEIAVAENDVPAAIQIGETLTKSKQVTASDLNQVAWLEVVTNTKLQDALATATDAVRLDATANTLNTKAVAEVESGDLRSAVEDGRKAIGLHLHGTPRNGDWYLQGRVAESVGLTDDAIAAYRQVKPPTLRFSVVPDTDTLAKRRRAALGKP